jgi:gas vesicle protein
MPGIEPQGAGVGAVVGVISGLFKSKKNEETRTLTGEQDRMFASAASAKRRASW